MNRITFVEGERYDATFRRLDGSLRTYLLLVHQGRVLLDSFDLGAVEDFPFEWHPWSEARFEQRSA
ncbi:hypothetical protein [Nocardioides coralli]|uniref:hypothetical protein n=1 Tax=Nocardioides coralli TaxID=2872154 RepID=UPI001CA4172A|nr:hypothetical protein [Nocardioides coralli]QZY29746.1 hypothetical protein K6T13_03365 [Nocardioides coralli]